MWYFGGCGGPVLCVDSIAISNWGRFHYPLAKVVRVYGDDDYRMLVAEYQDGVLVKHEFKFVRISTL